SEGLVFMVPSMMISRRTVVIEPNAPYALTRCQRLKLAFIFWFGDHRFAKAGPLSISRNTKTTAVRTSHQPGETTSTAPPAIAGACSHPHSGHPPPTRLYRNESLIAEKPSRMVSQF